MEYESTYNLNASCPRRTKQTNKTEVTSQIDMKNEKQNDCDTRLF